MILSSILIVALFSFLPISELRGGIPMGVARGMELWQAALLSTAINLAVVPVAYIFLETMHKLLYRLGWYKRLFDRFVERTRHKIEKSVDRFGALGLFLFVAIPLPVTGAWTGTLGAWLLGMHKRRAIPALMAGVVAAGIIVTLVVGLGVKALSIFVKQG